MKQALVLLGLAGCSQVFGLETPAHGGPHDGGGDGGKDSKTIDASNRCLQDSFDSPPPNTAMWSYLGMAQYTTIDMSGHLVVSPPPSTNGVWGLRSTSDLDLTTASVEVEVVQPAPSGTGEYTGLTVEATANTSFSIISLSSNLASYIIVNGAAPTGTSKPFTSAYRFWRMLFDAQGNVVFQTRPDTMSAWATFDTVTNNTPLTSARVLIGVGVLSTMNPSPGSATLDNFLVDKSGCSAAP